jgi:NAD-dependent SIR2 family protein deacetylase
MAVGYLGFEMYCVKCRKKQTSEWTMNVTMKNGKSAFKGKCSGCGTSMFKIGGVDANPFTAEEIKPEQTLYGYLKATF